MNKKGWMIAIIIVIILIGGGVWFYFSNINNANKKDNHYEANRTSTSNENQTSEEASSEESEKKEENTEETKKEEENKQEAPPAQEEKKVQYKEEQLSTFSTKIYSTDAARQNNIKITCDRLNGTTVKKGATFSFCNTLGPSTTSKGYQEADIYDNDGKKKKGLRRWKLSSKQYSIQCCIGCS